MQSWKNAIESGQFNQEEFSLQPPKLPFGHPKDDPEISGELMDNLGVGGGVNCYPGTSSGNCYDQAYIHVDYVSDPWGCMKAQMASCPNTMEIIFVGSRYALFFYNFTSRKGQLTKEFRDVRHGLRVVGKDMVVFSYHDGILYQFNEIHG